MHLVGIVIALCTSLSWSACSLFFTSASRRVGVLSMNHYRTLFGTALLMLANVVMFGSLWPAAGSEQIGLLVVSGLIGVVVGDYLLFHAYIDIGPRLGLLIFNVNPFITALLAQPLLGERLGRTSWIGITVTLLGTGWVLWEERGVGNIGRSRVHLLGIIFAILAALCQAVGYIIAKPAMTGVDGLDPLPATLIRVAAAVVGFWSIGLATGRLKRILSDLRNSTAMLHVMGGAITGPFIGIWFSLIALKLLPAGIAATLISTMPVMILPLVIIFYKEKVSWRAAVGAAIAVGGIAILFQA